MTIDQIKQATGATQPSAKKFASYLLETFTAYGLDSPTRQLCFLAQVGHESGGLFYTEELASGRAYEGRADLGNTHPGDGVTYKGRGLIQITGRANYQLLSEYLQVDFLAKPTLLGGKNAEHCSEEQLRYATLSAGWFWHKSGLNELADSLELHKPIDEAENLNHFKLITRRINGGYNGLSDRLTRFKKGLPYFL